jgi:type I restriction enzyme, R subunit
MPQISEANFEGTIELALLDGSVDTDEGWGIGGRSMREGRTWPTYRPAQHPYPSGYRKRSPDDYDRKLCLDAGLVVDFVQGTQPEVWKELRRQHGDDVKPRFLRRLAKEIEKRGTVDVLRHGIKESGQKVRLAYFRPSSTLNPEHRQKYEGNIFSVIRQLRYSESTADSRPGALRERPATLHRRAQEPAHRPDGRARGESVPARPRPPRAALQARPLRRPLRRRSRARFTSPPSSRVRRPASSPSTGAGRRGGEPAVPPTRRRVPTAYLWDRDLGARQRARPRPHFIHEVEEEEEDARGHGTSEKLIFPRYHQLDAVRRWSPTRGSGAGPALPDPAQRRQRQEQLHRLARPPALRAARRRRPARSSTRSSSITDRRVLDRQLQKTVRQFEQTWAWWRTSRTSRQAAQGGAGAGKKIIVTTLQKFPVIARRSELPGNRFAVIVDEAHSSQSGESTKSLKQALSAVESLEEAEAEDVLERRRTRGPHRRRDAEARAAEEREHLRLHRHAQGEDAGAVRHRRRPTAATRRSACTACARRSRRGSSSTCWRTTPPTRRTGSSSRRPRTTPVRAREGAPPAPGLRRAPRARHREKVRDHGGALPRERAHRIGGRAKAMIVTRSRLHAVRYQPGAGAVPQGAGLRRTAPSSPSPAP